MNGSPTDSEGSDPISFFSLGHKKIDQKKEKIKKQDHAL